MVKTDDQAIARPQGQATTVEKETAERTDKNGVTPTQANSAGQDVSADTVLAPTSPPTAHPSPHRRIRIQLESERLILKPQKGQIRMTYAWIALTLKAWGVAGIFDKKAVESASPKAVFVTFHLFLAVVALVLGVLLPWIYPDWHISTGVLYWEGLNAVAAMVAFLAYYYAMSKTRGILGFGHHSRLSIIGQLLSTPLTGEPFKVSSIAAAALVSLRRGAHRLVGWRRTEETEPQ